MLAEKMRRKKIIGGAMPNREKSRARRLQQQSPRTAGRPHAAKRCHLSAVNGRRFCRGTALAWHSAQMRRLARENPLASINSPAPTECWHLGWGQDFAFAPLL